MMPTVSVIIPAHNEERTIGSIIEVVRTWGKASDSIVIDDGSTDQTARAVTRLGNATTLISYRKNRGKGYAMAQGIKKCQGDILIFLDADVVGLTHLDLDMMLEPITSDQADMVLGIARFWNAGPFTPFDTLTGQRVLLKRTVEGHLHHMLGAGRGVEFLLNDLHKDKRVRLVPLPFVSILGKWEKGNVPDAVVDYLKEAMEFIRQISKLQSKTVTPQLKRTIGTVAGYLKQALDYVQQRP